MSSYIVECNKQMEMMKFLPDNQKIIVLNDLIYFHTKDITLLPKKDRCFSKIDNQILVALFNLELKKIEMNLKE